MPGYLRETGFISYWHKPNNKLSLVVNKFHLIDTADVSQFIVLLLLMARRSMQWWRAGVDGRWLWVPWLRQWCHKNLASWRKVQTRSERSLSSCKVGQRRDHQGWLLNIVYSYSHYWWDLWTRRFEVKLFSILFLCRCVDQVWHSTISIPLSLRF